MFQWVTGVPYHSPLPVVAKQEVSVWERAAAVTVPANVETTVLTHTVASSPLFLDELSMAGGFAAEFRVYLDAVLKLTERIEVGRPVARVPFHGLRVEVGGVLAVKVLHGQAGSTFDFEATLRGHK